MKSADVLEVIRKIYGIATIVIGIFGLGVWFTRFYDAIKAGRR